MNDNTTTMSSLPLGWTRVRRRNRSISRPTNHAVKSVTSDRVSSSSSCENDDGRKNSDLHEDDEEDEEAIARNRIDIYKSIRRCPVAAVHNDSVIIWTGRAIFCLHEMNCTWFQGYFFRNEPNTLGKTRDPLPSSLLSHSPPSLSDFCININSNQTHLSYGLLATNRTDIDDCIQCEDCGYRSLDVTLFLPPPTAVADSKDLLMEDPAIITSSSSTQRQGRKQVSFERVHGYGGEMLTLISSQQQQYQKDDASDIISYTHDNKKRKTTTTINEKMKETKITTHPWIEFHPDQLYTDAAAEPFLEKYFRDLLIQLSSRMLKTEENDVSETSSSSHTSSMMYDHLNHGCKYLDIIPDCAIIVGQMTLSFS